MTRKQPEDPRISALEPLNDHDIDLLCEIYELLAKWDLGDLINTQQKLMQASICLKETDFSKFGPEIKHRSSSGAVFSEDRRYRYGLWRIWNRSKGVVFFVGLNPSTADESQNDPTITRCQSFAQSWGYGGIIVGNLVAFRSSKPSLLTETADPIGSLNRRWLCEMKRHGALTVAAWGNKGRLYNQSQTVIQILGSVSCLGINKTGEPGHPLYISGSVRPRTYTRSAL